MFHSSHDFETIDFPSISMHASLFCRIISNPIAVSVLYVGGTIGALIGGSLCDRFGRKVTIMLTDVVFILGAILL